MSDHLQTALVNGLCFAVPTIIVSLINRSHVSKKIGEVHLQINSRLDELLEAEKGVSRLEGMAEQKEISEREKKAPSSTQ